MAKDAPTPSMPSRFESADVIDLSKSAERSRTAAGGPGGARTVVDVTEQTFGALMEQSATVPVVVDLWADWCEPCKQLSPILEKLAAEYAGEFLLAKIDTEAESALAQAFGVQSLPTVVGLIKGNLVQMFTGAYPEAQVRQVIEELLKVAKANGVSGRLAVDEQGEAVVETPLPPLHAEGLAAVERGDLAAGAEAFDKALKENPGDEDAKAALAQIHLLQRTEGLDADWALAAAASAPADVGAQMRAADAEMAAGRAEAAMDRILGAIRRTAGPEKDTLRLRLLDYFLVVGQDDERVMRARRALASALY